MKKIVLFISLSIILSSTLTAQSKMNFALVKKVQEGGSNDRMRPLDVFIKGDMDIIKELVINGGGKFKYSSGDIAAVSISIEQISTILPNKAIQRIEAYSSQARLLNDTMLVRSNVIPVHNGQTPLTQAYDGTGVVIGFIDSGIDFHHPDFKDNSGKSRVKYIWDHTLPTAANTPLPYGYGQEFTNLDIDNGLAEAHTDTVSAPSHGTHVAGVGAGNGLATGGYKGVAPGADIIMVALDFSNVSAVDAVNYIYSKAQAMGKPCVINASFGNYMGSHDGQDLEAQLISNLIDAQPGRAFVAAAGNAGNIPYHLGYTVTSDTNFTMFDGNGNIYFQLWADTSDLKNVDFSIGADKMTPVHSFRGQIPFSDISSHLGIISVDTLYNNGKRIGRIQSYGDLVGGTYSMEFYIVPDSTNYNWRLSTTGSGKFDLWDFDMVSTGLPSLATMPDSMFYKLPDVNKTIVSSFQCLDNVIAVANYTDRRSYMGYYDTLVVINTLVPGQRAMTSSIGPTRDGRMKPDIAAPGDMNIAAVVLTMVPGIVANYPDVLAKGGFHVRNGGTSHASPVVAGVAALYLQKNPTASAMDVKQAIIDCTTQDQFTGSSLPDSYWGYGKVNAFSALTCAPTSIADLGNEHSLLIYPNPASGGIILTMEVSDIRSTDKAELKIHNALGELLKTVPVTGSTVQIHTGLLPGIYFCSLLMSGKVTRNEKFVIYE
ncbi:MAG: S8 family peptidase [Bacteroidota bacterium]